MPTDNTKYTRNAPTLALPAYDTTTIIVRIFAWTTLTFLAVFLFSNFLTYWVGWPGVHGVIGGTSDVRSWIQIGLYPCAFVFAVIYVFRNRERPLRAESERIFGMSSFLIRTAFWSVLLIGLVDFSLAFLKGENFLEYFVGNSFARNLAKAEFRGAYIHMPLIAMSIVIAAISRTIGITWLALLLVVAELQIVMFRFIFSYEQDYMTDLVRFWYAALFLFGCAYTLREEGHVRVDVFYTNFSPEKKGLVNAVGTLMLGMPFCWLILIIGMSGKTGIINSALLSYEIEGLGDGLYILYLMTVFMGIFAISMLIEFVGYFLGAVADYRVESGGSSLAFSDIRQ